MSYRVRLSESAKRDMRTMPGNYRQRIWRLMDSLGDDPCPQSAKELRDRPGRYRIRIDSWRLIYDILDEEQIVWIVRVRKKTGPETYMDLNGYE